MTKNTAYTPASFLQNQDVESIYTRMKATAPSDIDTSEGSFFWDHTRPVAIEKSEMVEMQLNETLKVCFPQWSYGAYLDMHAEMAGIERKAATSSVTTLTVNGVPGTLIPEGFRFATLSVGNQPAIEFKTKVATTIGVTHLCEVEVSAVISGTSGNVTAGTITLMIQPLSGIISITNNIAASGGTTQEDDESLRARVLEAKRITPMSGSKTDYAMWAKEVDGIGDVHVIPEWEGAGTGTVKLIVIDSNGQPASPALISAVQNYIAPEDGSGLAPIGASVTVLAPIEHVINYAFNLTVKTGIDRAATITNINKAFSEYYKAVGVGGLLRYNIIAAKLATTEGVEDFSNLKINGDVINIQMTSDEYPVTGMVAIL